MYESLRALSAPRIIWSNSVFCVTSHIHLFRGELEELRSDAEMLEFPLKN
jgi:hypothetical protein